MGVNGIYGLSGSGMDIESMVKVGMMSKQNEYDKMAQKFTKNEWMKANYIELSSQINTFKTTSLETYTRQSNMNAKSAESSSSAVKVSAGSSTPLVSHQVEVKQLSSNASLMSTKSPTRYNGASSSSTALKDILFKNFNYDSTTNTFTGTPVGNNLNVDVTGADTKNAIEFVLKDGTKDANGNDNEATIKMTYKELAEGATFTDLVSQIKNSGLNISANYDAVYDKFSIFNTENGKDNTISIEIRAQNQSVKETTEYYTNTRTDTWKNYWGGYYSQGEATPEQHDSSRDTSTTLYSDIVASTTKDFLNVWGLQQVKNGDLSGTNMNFSWGENQTLKTKKIVETTVMYSGGDKDGTTKATPDTSSSLTTTQNYVDSHPAAQTISGENAQIKIDGTLYDKITDNKITVNGVTYTAVEKGTATVNISQDTDAIIDKVKSFVADYNKLLDSLYKKYDEKPNSDYKPLTQSQKDAMKEEQITKWEEKAKAGLLYHDQTLGRIIQKMRGAITDSVDLEDGSRVSIFSLGISTTGLKGQLVLDEEKLKKALDKDSEIVSKVFTSLGTNMDDYDTNGVAQRLSDISVEATKTIKSRAGSSADITEDSDLNNLLRQLQTRMSNFKKMMNSYENALYKKYDAMEATLAKLGTQLNFVMGGNA